MINLNIHFMSNHNNPEQFFQKSPQFFVGRTGEFNFITQNLAEIRICLITGLPGIGKTSFAAIIAEIIRKSDKKVIWIKCLKDWKSNTFFSKILRELCILDDELVDDMSLLKSEGAIETNIGAIFYDINQAGVNIFVDDFEMIEPKARTQIASFFNKYLQTSRIFFISREKIELNAAEMVDMPVIRLDYLNKDEYLELIERYEKFKSIPPIKGKNKRRNLAYGKRPPLAFQIFHRADIKRQELRKYNQTG